jgi:hypothetical protein
MTDDRKLTQDDFRRIVDDGIRDDVKALDGGRQDLQAARSLLEEFRLSNPKNVPPDLFDWLHDVFGRFLNGEAPGKPLGMKRGRGQRKKSGQVDPTAIAMFVKLKTAKGVKLKTAIDDASDFFHREIDTIRAALRDVEVEPGHSEETLRDYIREHRRPE